MGLEVDFDGFSNPNWSYLVLQARKNERAVMIAQRFSGPMNTDVAQTFPSSDEYKEDLSSAVSRTSEYGERATEESDAVIAESVYGDTGSAGGQVNTAGEV